MKRLGRLRLVIVSVLLVSPVACEQSKDILPDLDLPAPPPAEKLIELQNANAEPIDQLYTRAVVKITWHDEKDKKRFEEADGPLIYRRPTDLALALGKLGETWYWLGSDDERFWILDLHSDPRVAHVGSHAVAQANPQASPLPIRPDDLVVLMGVGKLPRVEGLTVELTDKGYLLRYPPDPARNGVRREVTMDGLARIVRVVLYDRRGEVLADAKRINPFRMEIRELPFEQQPWLARNTIIEIPTRRSTVEIFMPRTTRGKDKVRDVQFDFDKLVKVQRIEQIENLDERR